MADNENQKVSEKNKPRRPGIRTMVGDVREYAKGKSFSLSDLVSASQKRKIEAGEGGLPSKKIYIYAAVAILVTAIAGGGFFWFRSFTAAPEEVVVGPPPPLIPAGRQNIITVESEENAKTLVDKWRAAFGLQLLPREFLYTPVFNEGAGEFLDAKKLFDTANVEIPELLGSGIGPRSTSGIIDTARGNEMVVIMEITNYSSAFAGLLEWEKNLPTALLEFLKPNISYERGENVFLDQVVANNDARFLRNVLNEYVLGYSVFNRRFLIMTQSPQAMEVVIRQLSLFPPR